MSITCQVFRWTTHKQLLLGFEKLPIKLLYKNIEPQLCPRGDSGLTHKKERYEIFDCSVLIESLEVSFHVRLVDMPYWYGFERKQRYTRAEAIAAAAQYRSGHGGGSPESRIDAYYDYDAKCWRVGKVKKRYANCPRLK